jgi:hypothetical protein
MIEIEIDSVKLDKTGWLEITWVDKETRQQVYCQSFHPSQADLLRDKAAFYQTPLDDYEEELANWVTNYTQEPVDIDTLKRELRSAVTNTRWLLETGGITLPNGSKIKTSIDDQNRITSVISNAERAGLTEINFKDGDDNWISMPLTQLVEISKVVTFWVQDCFNAEMHHHQAIGALETIDELEQYKLEQINTNWPEKERELPQTPN